MCLMRLFWEILLPSLGLIKYDVINLLCYEHWKDKRKYIHICHIYLWHKKCPNLGRSKIATLAHDVIYIYSASWTHDLILSRLERLNGIQWWYGESPPAKNLLPFHLEKFLLHQIFVLSPPEVNSPPPLTINLQVITQ